MTQELKPKEVMLGNFIDSMGQVEMITEIRRIAEGEWYIGHHGWGREFSPLPNEISSAPCPIELTEEWKLFLGIEKYEGMPDHIQYVHQAQNWFLFHLRIDLFETIIDWHKLPKI